MLIDVKYAIGDKVRFKHTVVIVDKEACTFCNESGYVTGADGTTEECPRCEGKGYIEVEINGELTYEGEIKDIQVYYYENPTSGVTPNPYVMYKMSGWNWSQTWISESSIIEVIK